MTQAARQTLRSCPPPLWTEACSGEVFEIAKFSVDVEYRLRQGNLLHLRDGTYLKVTKELKHDILEKLAEIIYAFDAHPTKEDLAAVAIWIRHPCWTINIQIIYMQLENGCIVYMTILEWLMLCDPNRVVLRVIDFFIHV